MYITQSFGGLVFFALFPFHDKMQMFKIFL